MFTGIVRATTKVEELEENSDGLSISIKKPDDWEVSVGDSISVNGVCSTVTEVNAQISFTYMPESLDKSNLSTLCEGALVNLEQSLLASDRLDGHVVQGHVDTTAILESITPEGNSYILKLNVDEVSLLAPKGAVTLEGISLTIVDVGDNWFTVKIIPHTWENTNLRTKSEKDALNVEFDILAKYLKQINKTNADRE